MLVAITVIVLLVAALVGFAASRPDSFRIARSTVVAAPPEAIYPLIVDFRRWTSWSPYEALDADLARSYGGAASGVGATYAWEGRKAGAGHMEIIGETPPYLVSIRLEFTKPFKASNIAEFALRPDNGGTQVTWSMTGPQNFVAKTMGLFFNMDRMVGKDFETGLANIRKNAEPTS